MGIQNDSQLELFSQPNANNKNRYKLRNAFTGCFRNYEKIVILIICFLISWAIIFTLGVEKGKATAPLLQQEIKTNIAPEIKTVNIGQETPAIKQEETTPQIKETAAVKQEEITQQVKKPEEPKKNIKSITKSVKKGRFTIQLGSYQNKTIAQKEAQNLKKNGYTPLIISKGKYIILCVGNFTDEVKAKSILSKLKKQYNDCRIRRL